MDRGRPTERRTRTGTALAALAALGILPLLASPALAGDVPVSGRSLAFQWTASGFQRLVFRTEDPDLPFPEAGSADDPVTAQPGGVVLEVFSSGDDSVATYVLPKDGADPGWIEPGLAGRVLRFVHDDAPRGVSLVRRLKWKKGRRLRVVAPFVPLDQEKPRGSVAVRLTAGSTRLCAVFDAASITSDRRRGFFAGPSPKPAIADCSDEALGTAPLLRSGWIDDPWCEDGIATEGDPVDPAAALHRVTLRSPLAVCNDGSPAVFYIRPAPDGSMHAQDWILALEGEGSCGSPGLCADRWCLPDGRRSGAATMSSLGQPTLRTFDGLLGSSEDNAFADANAVVAMYCSSDDWSGGHTIDVPPSVSASEPERELPAYRIPFHGTHIVSALLLALRDGVAADADPSVTLPPITTASRVMLVGSAAGGAGAVNLATGIESFLRLIHPTIDVRLVADSVARPYEADGVSVLEPALQSARQAELAATRWRGGFLDQDCVNAHPGDAALCTQTTHLLFHHVALRAFSSFDLRDPVAGPWLPPALDSFETAARDLYRNFPDLASPETEAPSPIDFGYFAPRCGTRPVLGGPAFRSSLLDSGEGATSLHDALWAWWQGEALLRLVDGGETMSICEAE
jgi:hypothetical protein